MAQRMMATRSEKDAVQASLFFQLAHFCIRPWPWIIVGLAAIVLYGNPGPDEAHEHGERIEELKQEGVSFDELPERIPELQGVMDDPDRKAELRYSYSKRSGYVMAMRDHLPTGLRGLLLVAFIAAYLSTVSTQLNWGASYLVNDLYLPYMAGPDPPGEKQVRIGRLATVLLMLLSLLSTSFMTSISGVWEFILNAGAGLGGVLILRWYWWRINAWSELSATLAPFLGFAIGHFYLGPELGESFQAHKGPFFFTVLFSTLVWVIVTLITPPTDRSQLQAFYDRVEPGLGWRPFRQGRAKRSKHPGWLLLCWISALVMTYSLMFCIGKGLLHFFSEAGIWAAVALLSFGIFRYGLSRSGILKKKAEEG
jgi:hypothetical protein